MNQPKRDRVSPHTKRTPFLANGLCQTNNGRLSSCIVSLADVTVEAACRGNVNDGAVFALVGLCAIVGFSGT